MRAFAGFVLGTTAALAAVLVLGLVRADLAEEIFVLAVGAVTLLALVVATRGEKAQPSSFERALRPASTPQPNRPLELDRLERDVTLGVSGAFHLRHKLLPQLREVAAQRLTDRRGAALTEAAVGPDAWELLRPEGPDGYRDRHGRGIPIERLEALTDELEMI
ncbi:MAG: hypothetical protein ACXVZL_12180 [Gaiellaceae bacterium]